MRFWHACIVLMLLCACGREPSQASPVAQAVPDRPPSPSLLTLERSELLLSDFQSYCQRSVGRDLEGTSDRMLSSLFDRFIEFHLLLADSRLHQVSVSSEDVSEYRQSTHVTESDISDRELIPFIQVQKHIQLRLTNHISISDEEIAAYFHNHQKEFMQPASIDLSQIVCKNRNEAEEIWTQLNRHPESFSTLAQEHSIGVEAREGGHMGTFIRGQLPSEMESVVFSLGTGRISPVVESSFGYHIFIVHQRKQARQVSLEEARERIERTLYDQKQDAAMQNLIQNLAQTTPPVIHFSNLPFTYSGRWSPPAQSAPSAIEESS